MEEEIKHIYRMGKDERLRHKRLVDGLFAEGESLYDYPLRLRYRIMNEEDMESSFRNGIPKRVGSMQMMVTVPKKKLRYAVDRVRMRRLIRESYRLNRLKLKDKVKMHAGIRSLDMGFIYLHGERMDYEIIEKKMVRLLAKLEAEIDLKLGPMDTRHTTEHEGTEV